MRLKSFRSYWIRQSDKVYVVGHGLGASVMVRLCEFLDIPRKILYSCDEYLDSICAKAHMERIENVPDDFTMPDTHTWIGFYNTWCISTLPQCVFTPECTHSIFVCSDYDTMYHKALHNVFDLVFISLHMMRTCYVRFVKKFEPHALMVRLYDNYHKKDRGDYYWRRFLVLHRRNKNEQYKLYKYKIDTRKYKTCTMNQRFTLEDC